METQCLELLNQEISKENVIGILLEIFEQYQDQPKHQPETDSYETCLDTSLELTAFHIRHLISDPSFSMLEGDFIRHIIDKALLYYVADPNFDASRLITMLMEV
jgi:hypothetical protein